MYGFNLTVDGPFDAVVERVTEALKNEAPACSPTST